MHVWLDSSFSSGTATRDITHFTHLFRSYTDERMPRVFAARFLHKMLETYLWDPLRVDTTASPHFGRFVSCSAFTLRIHRLKPWLVLREGAKASQRNSLCVHIDPDSSPSLWCVCVLCCLRFLICLLCTIHFMLCSLRCYCTTIVMLQFWVAICVTVAFLSAPTSLACSDLFHQQAVSVCNFFFFAGLILRKKFPGVSQTSLTDTNSLHPEWLILFIDLLPPDQVNNHS